MGTRNRCCNLLCNPILFSLLFAGTAGTTPVVHRPPLAAVMKFVEATAIEAEVLLVEEVLHLVQAVAVQTGRATAHRLMAGSLPRGKPSLARPLATAFGGTASTLLVVVTCVWRKNSLVTTPTLPNNTLV